LLILGIHLDDHVRAAQVIVMQVNDVVARAAHYLHADLDTICDDVMSVFSPYSTARKLLKQAADIDHVLGRGAVDTGLAIAATIGRVGERAVVAARLIDRLRVVIRIPAGARSAPRGHISVRVVAIDRGAGLTYGVRLRCKPGVTAAGLLRRVVV